MKIVVESTKTTPLIDFIDGYMKIQGKSIPTINLGFYKDLMNYLEKYAEEPQNTTVVDINFDYINCYSKKSMMDVFRILEKIHKKGNKIIINWYYSEEDDHMLELGCIYRSLVDLSFNFLLK